MLELAKLLRGADRRFASHCPAHNEPSRPIRLMTKCMWSCSVSEWRTMCHW